MPHGDGRKSFMEQCMKASGAGSNPINGWRRPDASGRERP